jgi:hypothetical protein
MNNRGYHITQSPLYRIQGLKQFQKIVGLEWAAVEQFLSEDHYKVWTTASGRDIQAPIRTLKLVHRRIYKLLARIELPDYLHSQRGRSYSSNARAHLGEVPLIKTDISRFYPNVSRDKVFLMFVEQFRCAIDIAHRLADLCCYRQMHLPTGSPLSGLIAFFASRKMFDEIASRVATVGCVFTVYVDDITVSGQRATKRLLFEVRNIIESHGLLAKKEKSATFAAPAPKRVTGVIVLKNELRLPNERHLKIHDSRQSIMRAASSREKHIAQRTLEGRLREAASVLGSVGKPLDRGISIPER